MTITTIPIAVVNNGNKRQGYESDGDGDALQILKMFPSNWRKRKKKDISLQRKYELTTKRDGLTLLPVLNSKNLNDSLTVMVSTLAASLG